MTFMGCMLYFGSGITAHRIFASLNFIVSNKQAMMSCYTVLNTKSMVNLDLAGNSISHFL